MTRKLIDFRTRTWGHNLDARVADDGMLRGFCWCSPGPREGDEMVWRTGYGEARGIVKSSEWMINVDDMFKIAVVITDRIRSVEPH